MAKAGAGHGRGRKAMGLFRRRQAKEAERSHPQVNLLPPLHLSDRHRTTGELQWGMPSRCPECGGHGYLDHIDLVDEVMHQHCPTCWHRWTTSREQIESVAGSG